MRDPIVPRRARLATVALFLVTGIGLAVWVVSIPAVQARLEVSHGLLGGLILLLGAGSVVGMHSAGALIDRVGSKVSAVVAVTILVIGIAAPAFADNAVGLGVALLLLGLGQGAMDIVMNDQAVLVERQYGRPIMSSFHAMFSIGGVVGALLGVAIQTLRLDYSATLLAGAIVALVALVVAVPRLVPGRQESNEPESAEDGGAEALTGSRRTRLMIALGALAFVLMLAEGTANDWSALHAVQDRGVGQAAGSIAYATFAATMTIGRLTADRITHRLGPVAVVRYGCAVACLGMTAVVLAPWYGATLAGWALLGLGLSGTVPQVFSAAGNLGGKRGSTIARVVSAGYVGLLAGPAVVGVVSDIVGLSAALSIGIACGVVGVALAPSVRTRRVPASAR